MWPVPCLFLLMQTWHGPVKTTSSPDLRPQRYIRHNTLKQSPLSSSHMTKRPWFSYLILPLARLRAVYRDFWQAAFKAGIHSFLLVVVLCKNISPASNLIYFSLCVSRRSRRLVSTGSPCTAWWLSPSSDSRSSFCSCRYEMLFAKRSFHLF